MKTVVLVNIKPIYLDADTLHPVNNLTDHDKLLSSFTGKYLHTEIYTKLASFTGKTYKELDIKISEFAAYNNNYDFLSIITKK